MTAVGIPFATVARPLTAPPPAERPPAARGVVVGEVNLTGIGNDGRSPTAPVVFVNFSDFGCAYCASFPRETYRALAREFVETGELPFEYVPFAMGSCPNGGQAARASECAAEQGKFRPVHARLHARQRDRKNTVAAFPVFREEAARLGIDAAAFARCHDTRVTECLTERASIILRTLTQEKQP